MALSIGDAKGCAHVAYDGVAGDRYSFPGGKTWSVSRHWATRITGFKAALITTDNISVLAFAGTDSILDVIVDAAQVLGGMPAQYMQALVLADTARRHVSGRFELAGHSLGGGLAAFASSELNVPATTINPAPLVGALTLSSLFGRNHQITNYIARGGEFVSSSPGRNPGRDVEVDSRGGLFGFFTDHMLSNVAPGIPLPTKL